MASIPRSRLRSTSELVNVSAGVVWSTPSFSSRIWRLLLSATKSRTTPSPSAGANSMLVATSVTTRVIFTLSKPLISARSVRDSSGSTNADRGTDDGENPFNGFDNFSMDVNPSKSGSEPRNIAATTRRTAGGCYHAAALFAGGIGATPEPGWPAVRRTVCGRLRRGREHQPAAQPPADPARRHAGRVARRGEGCQRQTRASGRRGRRDRAGAGGLLARIPRAVHGRFRGVAWPLATHGPVALQGRTERHGAAGRVRPVRPRHLPRRRRLPRVWLGRRALRYRPSRRVPPTSRRALVALWRPGTTGEPRHRRGVLGAPEVPHAGAEGEPERARMPLHTADRARLADRGRDARDEERVPLAHGLPDVQRLRPQPVQEAPRRPAQQ